jgi:hypothetical protein
MKEENVLENKIKNFSFLLFKYANKWIVRGEDDA